MRFLPSFIAATLRAAGAVAVCCVLALLTTGNVAAQCQNSCALITIVNCQNTPVRVQAQLCCDNIITLSENFTVPGGSCSNTDAYQIGFLPCVVTGTFFFENNTQTYTWDPDTCTLTLH